MHVEEGRKQRRNLPRSNGPGLVVAKAEVHANPGLARHRFHRPVEEVHKPSNILPVAIATHGWFIDADFAASGSDERFQFLAHQRQQGLGQGPAVWIAQIGVGQEASRQGVGAGNRSLEGDPTRCAQFAGHAFQATVFLHCPESTGCLQWGDHRVATPLVMGRRPPPTGRGRLEVDPLKVAVETQIEVQPGLLAIGDDVQAGCQLVLHGTGHRIGLKLCAVLGTKALEVLGGMLQPGRKRVTANDRGSQWALIHGSRRWKALGRSDF